MPWISSKRLDELEAAAKKTDRPIKVNYDEQKIEAREAEIIDAFGVLWPQHSSALRALSKKRNPFADLVWGIRLRDPWPAEDVKTLIAMAEARRSESKAERIRAEVNALRSGRVLDEADA